MFSLPVITLSIALLGRLSPGPSAIPYRHNAQDVMQAPMVAIVTMGAPKRTCDPTAFSKPLDLDWQAEWARNMAHTAFDAMHLHPKNVPGELNVDVAPALIKGGGAVLVLKVGY